MTLDAYKIFRLQYVNDPVGFVLDCIHWRPGQKPTAYQISTMMDLVSYGRVAERGPHGIGKTALVAWLVLWFALTNDVDTDWKVPITASAWRQLTHFAWPEVKKWARRLKWDKIGRPPFNERTEILQLNLKLDTGEAFCLASDNSSLIEGAHAEHILYIFDEAKEIPADTWDSAEGAFSTGACFWFCVSTPGEPAGRFYDIHSRKPGYEDWHVRHVTLEEAIACGRMSPEWAEARKRQWGESSAVYQNRVLGLFAASSADTIIPLSWIEAANNRWEVLADAGRLYADPFTCVGVDVGRGGDKSTMALRRGKVIPEIRRNNVADTMYTTGQVKGIIDANGGYAVVDVIGIGAGVVDRLRELKCKVQAFGAAERSEGRDRSGELGFKNKRAAAWWNIRELLDPANDENLALPPDDTLTGDLVAPHWRVLSGGKIEVESKEDIKERIERSPDDGDAVVMAFFEEGSPTVQDWIDALKRRNEAAKVKETGYEFD